MKIAVFTIISNNYAAYARTLCQSLRRHQPDWDRHVLIVDTPWTEPLVPADEANSVHTGDLPLPIPRWFFFQYNILEANTAVKPWMFERLFGQGYDAVVYLDPDIKLYSPLEELPGLLSNHDIVLTPHITQPYPDMRLPNETHIRKSGIHNLGFAAFRRSETAQKALTWWKEKLTHDSRVAIAEGIFVDQSWMDFAPCFYESKSLNAPGYNVAYWNLHERQVNLNGFPATTPACNGQPVRFFHFSGFDHRNPRQLSRHQNRFHASNLPPGIGALLDDYAQNLRDNGVEQSGRIPYGLNEADGLRLPEFLRAEIVKHGAIKAILHHNAPATDFSRQLLDYLCSPDAKMPALPFFLARLYARRKDLREKFVGCEHGISIPLLAQWFERHGREEAGFDARFPADGWWTKETGVQRRLRRGAEKFTRRVLSRLPDHGPQILLALSPLYRALRGTARKKTRTRIRGTEKLFVNLYGYFLADSGMGEVARSLARMLESLEIPHRLINVDHGDTPGQYVLPFSLPNSEAHVDLVVVNADEFERFLKTHAEVAHSPRYRIGFWLWELDTPPPEFVRMEKRVNEIWCASRKNAQVFGRHTSLPVRVAPPSLSLEETTAHPFSLPDFLDAKRCVFLTLCDCLSHPERKNPAKALEAYLQAFPDIHPDSLILVKLHNGHHRPDTVRQLQELAEDRTDVFIWDQKIPRHAVNALLRRAQALISLHADEGFGLPIAEAISLGKEVVATAYGGNMDFCDANNTWLVPYQLVPLEKDIGPYRKGNRWASPDVGAAARYLQEIHVRWQKGLLGRAPAPFLEEKSRTQMAENLAAIHDACTRRP